MSSEIVAVTASIESGPSGIARRKAARGRAQALVEFALVSPLFLLIVVALLEGGRLTFSAMALQYGIQHAGRVGALAGTTAAVAVQNDAAANAFTLNLDPTTVNVTAYDAPGGSSIPYPGPAGSIVQVATSYTYQTLFTYAFPGLPSIPLAAQTQYKRE